MQDARYAREGKHKSKLGHRYIEVFDASPDHIRLVQDMQRARQEEARERDYRGAAAGYAYPTAAAGQAGYYGAAGYGTSAAYGTAAAAPAAAPRDMVLLRGLSYAVTPLDIAGFLRDYRVDVAQVRLCLNNNAPTGDVSAPTRVGLLQCSDEWGVGCVALAGLVSGL